MMFANRKYIIMRILMLIYEYTTEKPTGPADFNINFRVKQLSSAASN